MVRPGRKSAGVSERLRPDLPDPQADRIIFGPHTFRHTYATELLRRGVAVEVVGKLLGHTSITTTSDTYAHLKIEDARRALVAAGWLTDKEVQR